MSEQRRFVTLTRYRYSAPHLVEDPGGSYVRFSDYEALLDRLGEEVERLREDAVAFERTETDSRFGQSVIGAAHSARLALESNADRLSSILREHGGETPKKCERCNGNGRVEMLEHCPVCKGSGRR